MGILAFMFLIWIGGAILIGMYANNKGRSGGWFCFWAVILGPFIVGLVAVLVHDRPRPRTLADVPVATVPPAQRWISPVAPATDTRVDTLKQLADLHDRGALTDDEFAAEKSRLLGGVRV